MTENEKQEIRDLVAKYQAKNREISRQNRARIMDEYFERRARSIDAMHIEFVIGIFAIVAFFVVFFLAVAWVAAILGGGG